MTRIDRIRRSVVARIVASETWWEDATELPPGDGVSLTGEALAHRLARQAQGRRRQIVERLMTLSVQGSY